MSSLWDTELTEEETEDLLNKASENILKRKLHVPAILALEMHKPIANVGAHAAVAFSGFLVPMFGYDFVNNYSRLLSKRENIERLIQKLEENRQ